MSRVLIAIEFFVLGFPVVRGQIALNNRVLGELDVVDKKEIRLLPGFHAPKGTSFHASIQDTCTYQTPVLVNKPEAAVVEDNGVLLGRNYVKASSPRKIMQGGYFAEYPNSEITYYDDLGSPVQIVKVQASPSGMDLVVPLLTSYNVSNDQYLPFAVKPKQGEIGYYRKNVDVDCYGFYSKLGPEFENEKLFATYELDGNEVVKIQGSGKHWAGPDLGWFIKPTVDLDNIVFGVGSQDRFTEYGVSPNTSELATWDETGNSVTKGKGSLMVSTVSDENGNVTREYANALGQTLVKEVETGTEVLRTHYVYDAQGLLAMVVPPLAASPEDLELCYFYRYDDRKRMVSKKIPGAAIVEMVYDQRDRLVMVQDGNLRAKKEYLFYKYDCFDRMVLSGKIAAEKSVEEIRALFANHTGPQYERYTGGTGLYGYGGNDSYPQELKIEKPNVLNAIWYDEYRFVENLGINALSYNGHPSEYAWTNVRADEKLRALGFIPTWSTENYETKRSMGLTTGQMVKVPDIGNAGYKPLADELYTSMYYDTNGNVMREISSDHLGGWNVFDFQYDPITSWLERSVQYRYLNGNRQLKEVKEYKYDHYGRLLECIAKINDQPAVVSKAMRYNELGQLDQKYLHSPTVTGEERSFVQKVDYGYNVRGWLTSINGGLRTEISDLFGMDLYYSHLDGVGGETACGSEQFNGNIAAIRWSNRNDVVRGYLFGYDKANRLTNGAYGENATLESNKGRFSETIDGYDANGNITKLKRRVRGTLADDLAYTYMPNDNRLLSVADNGGEAEGVMHYVRRGNDDYAYDANGNMVRDPGKATSVTYNHLNLPECVTFPGGNKIFYHYDASGRKVCRSLESGSGEQFESTHYVGNLVFEGDGPAALFNDEGRAVYDPADGKWCHEYFLKDHLGNTRVVFAGTLIPGGADVLQVNNYYPFGLPFECNDFAHAVDNYVENRYLYNGKELQRDGFGGVELGWYDFHWRQYMADLGRTATMDPLCEFNYKMSPYHFVKNNPVMYIDPTGLRERKWWNPLDWFRTEDDTPPVNEGDPIVLPEVTTVAPRKEKSSDTNTSLNFGYWQPFGYLFQDETGREGKGPYRAGNTEVIHDANSLFNMLKGQNSMFDGKGHKWRFFLNHVKDGVKLGLDEALEQTSDEEIYHNATGEKTPPTDAKGKIVVRVEYQVLDRDRPYLMRNGQMNWKGKQGDTTMIYHVYYTQKGSYFSLDSSKLERYK